MHCSVRISRAACKLRHDTTGPLFPGVRQARFRIAIYAALRQRYASHAVIGRPVAPPPTLWTFEASSRHIAGKLNLPDAQPPRGPCPPLLRLRRLTAPDLALSRNGTWPTFTRHPIHPLSAATSRAPTVRRNPSLRNGGAGWPTSPGRNLQLPSPAMRPCPTFLAASAPMPASIYAGDTTDPARAKFYGDVQEKLTDAHHATSCSSSSSSTASTTRLLERAMADPGARPLPALARGPAQGEAATSSTTASSSSSTRSRVTGGAPGTASSTRPWPRSASRSTARSWRSSRPSTSSQDRDEAKRAGRRRGARRDASRTTSASSRLITNTLAKDKEISDRWRGFKDVADARHLCQPRRARGRRGPGRRRPRRLSAPVAPLLRD